MLEEATCAAEADKLPFRLGEVPGTHIRVDFVGVLGRFDMNSIWLNCAVRLISLVNFFVFQLWEETGGKLIFYSSALNYFKAKILNSDCSAQQTFGKAVVSEGCSCTARHFRL